MTVEFSLINSYGMCSGEFKTGQVIDVDYLEPIPFILGLYFLEKEYVVLLY